MNDLFLYIFLILLGLLGAQSPLFSFLPAYKVIVVTAGAAVLVFVSSLPGGKLRDPGPGRFTPLSILYLLFLAWSAAGLLYSADPENSWVLTVQSLGASLLFLGLTLQVRDEVQVERILRLLLFFGGTIALIGILQQFPLALLKNPVSTDSNSTSLFVHRNVFAGYLVILIPLACLVYFSTADKIRRRGAGVSFVFLLAALGFSGSRGGHLVGILLILVILGYLGLNKDRRGVLHLLLGVALSLVVYFGVDLAVRSTGIEPNRTAISGSVGYSQSLNRILYWQAAWEIFKDHWLIGSGPLSFSTLFPKYFLHITHPLVKIKYLADLPPHAHNLFVETASDSGLVGIGLMLAFLALFYHRAHRLFWHSVREIRSRVFFVTLAVTAFLIHHMIEYNWSGTMFIYHFTLLLFVMDFMDRKHFPPAGTRWTGSRLALPGSGMVLIFFILVSSANYYRFQNVLYDRPPKSATLEDLETAASRAKRICPRCDSPYLTLAENIFERYLEKPDMKLLARAEKELMGGIRLNPYNPVYLAHLGQVRAVQGRYDEALTLFKQALQYNKTQVIASMGLNAVMLKHMGRVDRAGAHKP